MQEEEHFYHKWLYSTQRDCLSHWSFKEGWTVRVFCFWLFFFFFLPSSQWTKVAQGKGQQSHRHDKLLASSLHGLSAVWINSVILLQEKSDLPLCSSSAHTVDRHTERQGFCSHSDPPAAERLRLHSVPFWTHRPLGSSVPRLHLLQVAHMFGICLAPLCTFSSQILSLREFSSSVFFHSSKGQGQTLDSGWPQSNGGKCRKKSLRRVSQLYTCQLTKHRLLGTSYVETVYLELSQ